MEQFTQIIGEDPEYQQDLVNDTIASAEWTVSPTGPTITVVATTETYSRIRFKQKSPGVFLLTVAVVTDSGQTLKGQAQVDVLARK